MTNQEDTPMDTETTPEQTTESLVDTVVDGEDREATTSSIEEPQSKREARYRAQLRETEAQRDQLAGTVEAMQRAEIERLAAGIIAKPEALWASGTAVADLLGDDGLVDPSKVNAAAHAAREELGLELGADERKKRGPVVPREGTGTDQTRRHTPWEDAFKQE